MITGFQAVTLAARDPGGAAAVYGRVFGRPAELHADGSHVIALSNLTLSIRALKLGEEEGLARITFAARGLDDTRRLLERRRATSRLDGDAAVIDAAASHGVDLALAEADDSAVPAAGAEAIEGLDHVVIRSADADRAIALYAGRLGLDFRLDRSNPAWGSRLLFFRCGDAVVEIAVEAASTSPDAADRLSGLAWRARDPAAVHGRLSSQGFDVSELRAGRKPGTQVFTLRSGVLAAPSLVIGSETDT